MNDCILFAGKSRTKEGYGLKYYKGRTWVAHRLAWTLANGEVPNGLFVLHACDIPACVNVEHLWLGTIMENVLDCMLKGRHNRGEKIPSSKLTWVKVRNIRRSTEHDTVLAKRYGVHRSTIGKVRKGRYWNE